jgi:hypothetical protein
MEAVAALEGLGAATAVSLDLPENMTYERYEALGVALSSAREKITWWIAEWIRYGETNYGEKYAQAVEVTGLTVGTCMTYASIANRVPVERRRPELKFGHHAEVASLKPDDQIRWLDDAVTNGWKRDELRSRLQHAKAPDLQRAVEVIDLETAALDLVRSAKKYGNDFLVMRPSFVALCASLGEEL